VKSLDVTVVRIVKKNKLINMGINDSFNGLIRDLREDILVGLMCSDSKSVSGEPGSVVK
jgi:hypothetical protein